MEERKSAGPLYVHFSSKKGKIIPQVVLNFRREIILLNGGGATKDRGEI